jgi:hypothetical protein
LNVPYIVISVTVLTIIAVLVFFISKNKKEKGLSILASLSFLFIIFGIIFGDDRIIAYSLMGFGVLLAVTDIVRKLKPKEGGSG